MLPLSFLLLTLLSLPAMAYDINGDISDWGVNLKTAYADDYQNSLNPVNGYYSAAWIPTNHPTVDWIIENNIDPTLTGNSKYPDWTGYGLTGTHKYGTGSQSNTYNEPLITAYDSSTHLQPSGGEAYDIEAVYFDDDSQNMYLAIVTSMPQTGLGGWQMGDIALDITHNDGKTGTLDDAKYEYGIKTHDEGGKLKGLIRKQPTWEDPASNQFPNDKPYRFDVTSGHPADPDGITDITANLKYTTVTGAPEQMKDGTYPDNYVIEVSIPKRAIGYPSAGQVSNLHLAIGCGNDEIVLNPITFKQNIPEFPSIALPVAAIMGVILILGRRNKE